jgi:NADPH:quinone reductase-like Zn-dependent oxidoreductase
MKADGWFLYAGDGSRDARPGQLVRETFEVPRLKENQVLVEPLFGSWEGNMGHAVMRRPVDVCLQRGEPKVILGNSGVVRVLEIGKAVTTVKPDQLAIVLGSGEVDRFGYMVKAMAYDAVGTMGLLATRSVVDQITLIPLPTENQIPAP